MYSVLLASVLNQVNFNGLPQPGTDGSALRTILSIIIGIVGALCLLFITIGGMRYVLSQGDPQGVAKAKGTIIYALIGLVVVILAQAIVSFVVGRIS